MADTCDSLLIPYQEHFQLGILLKKIYSVQDITVNDLYKSMVTIPKIRPPFTEVTAKAKVKAAQDIWNTCNPELVAQAYTEDARWRNRTEFMIGRKAIIAFLERKWARELDYHLMKELWCYTKNRISVRFEYEWRDALREHQWIRTHGNEHWEFAENGLMRIRDMSANDYEINELERRYKG